MFSLFLEDLELFLCEDPNCGLNLDDITFILMLFADDMVILCKSPSDLQKSINLLHKYCETWGLEVNIEKTKIVVFRKRGPLKFDEQWSYDNEPLEVVNDFNYLGTVFNYTGNYSLNQETLAGKGLKALNVLLSNTRKYTLKPRTVCQLFDAFVGSTLNYACEIWGFSKSKEIERIHLKFCKYLLNVKTSTCNMGVYGELGRYPLYINRYVRMIKYWTRIVKSDNILVKYLYKSLLVDCNKGTKNWLKNIKSLLDDYGFSYIWTNVDDVNLLNFHILFKERVLDNFKQKWFNEIENSRSLCTYKFLKNTFEFENYLDIYAT